VFRIDEGGRAAQLLHFGNNLQGEGGLAGGFRTIDFDHSAARQAAYAKRNIQPQGTSRDGLNVAHHIMVAEAHHRAFAKLFFNLAQRGVQGLQLVFCQYG
jgi:hypothetical protein